MKYAIRTALTASAIVLGIGACSVLADTDLTAQFAEEPELERLRYFREINLSDTRTKYGLTGQGVRIIVMGEIVDSTHPEITSAVVDQFNTFAQPGTILPGRENNPYRPELLRNGDGHGTHIAGTIAASCDGIGIQGVACGASLDVYDLGAYGDMDRYREVPFEGSEVEETFEFLTAFRDAMLDVTERGESKITTGSFNLEAPALRFENASELTIADLDTWLEEESSWLSSPSEKDLIASPLFDGVSERSLAMLTKQTENNGNDFGIPALALAPALREFKHLADAIAEYQDNGGVYIVTESNYDFGKNTSALNAMPTLAEQVDPGLWLSVVMVVPEDIGNVETEADLDAALNGKYVAPLNGCGEMAQDYCIVTPSYQVLSTMTERVAGKDDERYTLDGMTYVAYSGHSMGAPMVAAALALMQEFNETRGLGLSMHEMVHILKQEADRSFEGYDPVRHGRGMLDIDAAIEALTAL